MPFDKNARDTTGRRSIFKKLSSIIQQNPKDVEDVLQEYVSILNVSDHKQRDHLDNTSLFVPLLKRMPDIRSYDIEMMDRLLRALELIQKRDRQLADYKKRVQGASEVIVYLKSMTPVDKLRKRGTLHPSNEKVDEV